MVKKKRAKRGKPKRAVKAVRRKAARSRSRRAAKAGRRVRSSHPVAKGRKKLKKAKKAQKAKRLKKVVDPRVAQAMKQYEEAMRQFNKQSYRRAKAVFEKVVVGYSRELAERARVHLTMCEQRLQRAEPLRLRTADDHYHYAVSQINLGNYDEARTHLEKARKLAPKGDHVFYALASVAALLDEPEEALQHLDLAIKLRPENRYHARHDSDFAYLQDDPRFQELLYPNRLATPGARELYT
jgi:tetratricopeptide (TPR) repeat protein